MEAVPRLPMCSFELKISPQSTEFGPPIKKYIAEFHHEDPDSYIKEIKELETLRQSACKVPRDFTGCRILKRYFAQLHCLESRFPLSENGAASVAFMWTDIYSGMVFNITDIHYEQACILYNIGALHSELGANDMRTNEEGMKVACTHFQCAAWAFQHLRETYPQLKGSDMSYDILTFFITLMLAQAQECILEKSMLDSRKSSITAKIAAQVVEYYRSALSTLTAVSGDGDCIMAIVGSKLYTHWKKVMEFKIEYYMSISNLYMGNQAEEQQLMGERVAWYSAALEKHGNASKVAKGIDREDLNEALAFTLDVIAGKCNAAKKENDFVYHEKVVPTDSLPEIKGASLVKGVPFSVTDPDVCGPDIFMRLIPMETHEASSIYSEEKAKLRRDIGTKIEDRNQELVAFMSSLNLDQDILSPKTDKLPQELLEKCAALSVKPTAIQDLRASLKGLLEIYEEVDNSLKEVSEFLQREEEQEKRHQEVFGKRAPSLITVELSKENSKYETAHKRAAESNATLQKALDIHLEKLQLLLLPPDELKQALPSINSRDAHKDNSVQEIRMLLDKIEEMKKQRIMLEQQLYDSIQKDDITKILVTRDKDDSLQKLFEEQLKKHEGIKGYLEQNLGAQDNILRALTNANARFADTRRNVTEILRKRDMMIGALLSSFDAYEDLTLKTQKGLEFYQRLRSNVQRLQARVRSVTSVQEEERTQIAQANAKKVAKAQIPSAAMSPAITPGAPKLKDYLPYMTGRTGISTENLPASVKPANTWSPSRPVAANETIPPSPLNADSIDYNVSGNYSMENVTPMGIRPAPVGSEHTSSVSCTPSTAYDSSLAGAMGIYSSKSGDMKDKAWGYVTSYGSYPVSYPEDPSYRYATGAPTSVTTSGVAPVQPASQSYNYGTPSAVPVTATVSAQYFSGQPYSGQTDQSFVKPQNTVSNTYSAGPTPQTYGPSVYAQTSTTQSYVTGQQPASPYNMSSSAYAPTSITQSYTATQPSATVYNYPQITPEQAPPVAQGQVYPQGSTTQAYQTYPQSSVNQSYPASSANITYPQDSVNQGYSPLNQAYPQNSEQAYVQSSTNQAFSQATGHNIPTSQTFTNPPPSHSPNTATQTAGQDYSSYQPTASVGTEHSKANYQYMYRQQSESYSAYQPAVSQGYATSYSSNGYSQQQTQDQATAGYQSVPKPQTSTYDQSYIAGSVQQPEMMHAASYSQGYMSANYYTGNASQQQPINQISADGTMAQSTPQINYQSYTTAPNTSYQNEPANVAYQQYYASNPSASPASNPNPQPPAKPSYASDLAGITPLQPTILSPKKYVEPAELAPKPVEAVPPMVQPAVKRGSISGGSVSSVSSGHSSISCSPLHLQNDDKKEVSESLVEDFLKPSAKPKSIPSSEPTNEKEKPDENIYIKDPLLDNTILERFTAEVDKFKKIVEGLTKKSLNGPTPLDQKWKEITDSQDKESRKLSISVARCYPLKNRLPDVMPYDSNRVELQSLRNDYINASYIKNLVPCSPKYIVTQAPMSSTLTDFWVMVWEQQVEVVVCIVTVTELKGQIYWPIERGQPLVHGPLTLNLQSCKELQFYTESMISITHNETKMSRMVIHLQFANWPPGGIPNNPALFLQFVNEVHNYHKQQRNLQRPVVVHCLSGVGRSGVFCLLSGAMKELALGHNPPDLGLLATKASHQRKFFLQEKEHLKFCYEAALYHAQDILVKCGILSNKTTFDEKIPDVKTHTRHPSQDFILGGLVPKPDKPAEPEKLEAKDDGNTVEKPPSKPVESVTSKTFDPVTKPLLPTETVPRKDASNVTSILDPANFTLEPLSGKKRFSKECFQNPLGLVPPQSNASDPLSQLDPLWTIKKD